MDAQKDGGGVVSLTGAVAGSTRKGPKAENQDSFRCGVLGTSKVLIIADGVTQCSHGGEAAQIAVDCFYSTIAESLGLGLAMSFQVLDRCYEATVDRLRQAAVAHLGKAEGFETTLIAIVETEDRFFITYLGDGSIFLVRGDLMRGVQLMVSHRVGSYLGGAIRASGIVSKPVYIEHSKSFASGEVVIAATDGALPRAAEGGDTIEVEKLLHEIAGKTTGAGRLQETLDVILSSALEELGDPDDDATIGIIVTGEAERTILRMRE